MANNRNKLSGRRGSKPTKVVDLEATEKSEDLEEVVEAASEIKDDAVSEAIDTSESDSADAESAAEVEGEAIAPVAPPQKAKASFGSLLFSAILGGGVALGGASLIGTNSALQSVPVIGGLFASDDDSGAVDGLNSEIAALKDQIAKLQSTPASVSPEVSDRLAALESGIAAVGSAGENNGESPKVEEALNLANAAAQKADEVSQKIAELSSKIVEGAGGDSVDMDALKAALSGELTVLASKVLTIEKSLGAENSGQTTEELSSIKESINSLSDIPGKVESLSTSVSGMSADSQQLTDTITSLADRLKAVETSVDEKILPSMSSVEKAAVAAVESQKVARSVSARALSAVLENGGAFSSELASAEALLGTNDTIEALRALSRKGIQSKSGLLAGFGPVGDQIISLQSEDTAEMGVLDRFLSSAQSLVKVRPAGPVEGDSNAAIVSRIEAAIKSNDLAGAMSEWDGLSDPAKTASGDWAQNVRDYQNADGLINTLIGELSTSSSEQG